MSDTTIAKVDIHLLYIKYTLTLRQKKLYNDSNKLEER